MKKLFALAVTFLGGVALISVATADETLFGIDTVVVAEEIPFTHIETAARTIAEPDVSLFYLETAARPADESEQVPLYAGLDSVMAH